MLCGHADQADMSRLRAAPDRPAVWLELEDTIRHFDSGAQPTGIPRVTLAVAEALHRSGPGRARYCRLGWYSGRWQTLTFDAVKAECRPAPARPQRSHLPAAMRAFSNGIRFARRNAAVLTGDLFRLATSRGVVPPGLDSGDWIVVPGSGWQNASYGAGLDLVRQRCGARIAVFVHDIIPLEYPQFSTDQSRRQFARWYEQVLLRSDLILTASEHVRNVLRARSVRVPIERIPLGATPLTPPSASRGTAIDLPDDFVLVVGTLEPRKNHLSLVRVWRTLIERWGDRRVPSLVFAGRYGWMIDDLKRELRASANLNGKVIVRADLTDAGLSEAYARCLFTVFPSFCEGWGFPVAESLAFGKVCIASDRTSIPEVGGDCADYIDPDDDATILRAVERAVFDSRYRNERMAHIRSRYRPATWDDCARQILQAVDECDAARAAGAAGSGD
jgi:glycosyltransferase involved in cell wall biosynthesis